MVFCENSPKPSENRNSTISSIMTLVRKPLHVITPVTIFSRNFFIMPCFVVLLFVRKSMASS